MHARSKATYRTTWLTKVHSKSVTKRKAYFQKISWCDFRHKFRNRTTLKHCERVAIINQTSLRETSGWEKERSWAVRKVRKGWRSDWKE